MYENLKFVYGGKFYRKDEWLHETRTIDTTEIIIVTGGEVNMFVEGESYSLKEGEVLKILPGERHGGTVPSNMTSFFWLHFNTDEQIPLKTAFKPQNCDRVMLLAKELLHYAEADGYPDECVDAMMRVLLFELQHSSGETGKIVSDIKERVRRAGGRGLMISDLSKEMGYSEDYLCRVFKRSLGIQLKRYITGARVDVIKRDLLIGAESLYELSEKYGFAEYKYFLKFFKYHTGISPSSYRKTYYNLHTN